MLAKIDIELLFFQTFVGHLPILEWWLSIESGNKLSLCWVAKGPWPGLWSETYNLQMLQLKSKDPKPNTVGK